MQQGTSWLQAAAQATADAAPMIAEVVPTVPGRELHLDGDMLAYWAGGNDDTSVATSRSIALNKIEAMRYQAGAERVIVHLTARTSHKANRFIIATQKVYQGQRKSGRKPKNWEYLRDLMESASLPHRVKLWATREADDGFAYVAREVGPRAVIGTKDKDMRMITGCWHMSWDDMRMVWVPPNTFAQMSNDLLYGHKWFWQQMLQGDTADNIPGLPRYNNKPVGEATAKSILSNCNDNSEAYWRVSVAYELHYADDWKHRFLEQALLLWLRQGRDAHVSDVFAIIPQSIFADPMMLIEQRIKDAYAEAAAIQGGTSPRTDAG